MVVVVVPRQIVDVAGADQGAADLPGEADDPFVHLVLLGDAVDLDLHVEVVAPDRLDQVVEVRTGIGGSLLQDPPRQARLEAAGERDQAGGVAFEQVDVDVCLAAPEALQEAGRRQLHEVAEALVRAGEEREVVALAAAVRGAVVVDEVGLHPDDGLDSHLLARLVVVDGAVHGPVIGDPEGGHAQARPPAPPSERRCP